MGNGSGTSFVADAIGVATSGTLSAGGTTALQVSIVDQTDTLYTGSSVTVNFNSPCIASGNAGILTSGSTTPVTTVTTSTGSVNVTYEALGCSGTDVVTATAVVGGSSGQSVSATATLTIAAATVGSIQFVSATPTTIGLKGTGLNETSTLVFKVENQNGGPSSGVPVSFAITTASGGTPPGGVSLSPTTATSSADGMVQTVVSSGTVHGSIVVSASVASPALSTLSTDLSITTGLPASGAFSIAVGAATYGTTTSTLACPNVEAFAIDGVSVPVTVRLADRYNNPAPDGTAVSFTTNGGHIVGSCTTPLSTSGDGACKVTWTSANPRPGLDTVTSPETIDLGYSYPAGYPDLKAAGRATVLATATGEESFNDAPGLGFYQSGDTFSNLGEPYRDDNENGSYDSGEYFLDYNGNGQRNAGTGSFVGITCTGTTPGSTCTTSTLAIGASHLIIMSTSSADPTLYSVSGFTNGGTSSAPVLSISHSSSGTLVVNVKDTNGNSMAAGTGIAFGVAPSSLGTVTAEGPTTVGCNSDLGGDNFEAAFAPSTSAAGLSGSLTVTVTSPNGTQTLFSIPLSIS
jgi:hypothetical protein